MTSRRAKLHEDTNFRLMRILEANSDLSQREMGKALGISFGGINYCLNALVAKGVVKIENLQPQPKQVRLCLPPDAERDCRKGSADQRLLEAQDGRVRSAQD